jgi:hypothetical protein
MPTFFFYTPFQTIVAPFFFIHPFQNFVALLILLLCTLSISCCSTKGSAAAEYITSTVMDCNGGFKTALSLPGTSQSKVAIVADGQKYDAEEGGAAKKGSHVAVFKHPP